jgi:Uma2 family endonuclease
MSLEEWASLPEDQPGELVDGELVEDEAADWDHEYVVGWIFGVLWTWMEALARGQTGAAEGRAQAPSRVYGSDGKYAVRAGHGRKADVSVFLPGTPLPPRRGPCTTPPDVLVEVISSDPRDVRRDRIEKAAEYAAFGVRFYWLIDPDARTFEIYELQPGGRYLRVVGVSEGAVDVPGCEGLRLDLDALWAKLDQLA